MPVRNPMPEPQNGFGSHGAGHGRPGRRGRRLAQEPLVEHAERYDDEGDPDDEVDDIAVALDIPEDQRADDDPQDTAQADLQGGLLVDVLHLQVLDRPGTGREDHGREGGAHGKGRVEVEPEADHGHDDGAPACTQDPPTTPAKRPVTRYAR